MNSDSDGQAGGPSREKEFNLARSVTEGGVWIFLARWSSRGIGFVSTIILARLLAPEDFGLIAICTILTSLAETLGREAQNLAVIRQQNLDREYMDSAWTASVLVSFLLGLCIVAAAPLAASFFHEPRALLLVQIMSVRIFIMGFENIGMALYRKDFNFNMSYKYVVLEKIFPVMITISLAIYLGNYWALAVGSIAGFALLIITSYILHEYRPRICFTKIREVWGFSGWIILEKLAVFFSLRIDYLFIPRIADTAEIGHYHVGAELARMPTIELFSVLDRAIFPAYALIRDDRTRMANAFINVFYAAAIVYFPVSIGFALVADDAVSLIYGGKWIPMVPVVTLISLAAGLSGLISMVTIALQATGKSRLAAGILWLHVIFLGVGLFAFKNHFDNTSDIAFVRLFTTLAVFPMALIAVQKTLFIGWRETLIVFWRPVLAVLAMTLVLLYFLPADMDLPRGLRIGIRCLAGGFTYTIMLLLLWVAAGRPSGTEQTIIELLAGRWPLFRRLKT